MALIATSKGGDFEKPPVGVFPAVCVQVIDLGTQKNEYEGKVSTPRQVRIGWELTGSDKLGSGASHTMADGKPFLVTEIYTLSLGEQANLRAILEGWRGRPFTDDELDGFDISALLGKGCLLDIIHKAKKNGSTKAKVNSVKRWASEDKAPVPVNKEIMFDLTAFDPAVYNGLSDWLQQKIAQSPEYAEAVGRVLKEDPAKDAPFDDEIPF